MDFAKGGWRKMRYSIHAKNLDAKKARILVNAVVDCAKAGVRPSFTINKILWGLSLYLECGHFRRENWRSYHRFSEAAKRIRDFGDNDWKRGLTLRACPPAEQDVPDAAG